MTPAVSKRQTVAMPLFSMEPSGGKYEKWLYLEPMFASGHIIVFQRKESRENKLKSFVSL